MSNTKPNRQASNSMTSTKPMSVPPTQTFLQALSCQVTFCINYRIQTCHIPPELQLSQETYFLHQEIITMQRKLKAAIRRDYEVQKGKILLERKRVIDKSS
jgi:hypothetical protein